MGRFADGSHRSALLRRTNHCHGLSERPPADFGQWTVWHIDTNGQDVTALTQAIGAALDGEITRSVEESWQPYTQAFVVDKYINLLLNGHA